MKTIIHKEIYKRGDIFIANLPKTAENVYFGIHPVVIVGNNLGNKYSPVVVVCPITSQLKPIMKTHVDIQLDVYSTILCEQILTVNKNCMIRLMAIASQDRLMHINKALLVSLGL